MKYFTCVSLLLTLNGFCASSEVEERLQKLENEMVNLKEHVHEQNVSIGRLNKVIFQQNDQIKNMTRRSVQLGAPGSFLATMDHVILSQPQNTPVVFNNVINNEGNAYNSHNGKFTASLDGIYLFSFSMHVNRDTQAFLQLVHNGVQIVGSVTESTADYHDTQGGNTAVIKLFSGDQVWVEVFHDDHDRLEGKYGGTSFTGTWIAYY